MYEPLVSIITPVYNAERYLLETIESVMSQVYTNWEWILVDDCSTDDSFVILSKKASEDTRIRVYNNESNSGAYRARNKALSVAKGDFVAFLDADDLWRPEKLKIQLELMQQNNSLFTYTDFDRFVSNPQVPLKKENLPLTAPYKKILVNNYIATSTVMIWKDRIGEFWMKDVYYDDFTLWLDLLKRIDFAEKVPHNLMHYRLVSSSLSSNKFKSAREVYLMFTSKMGFNYINGLGYFVIWAFNTTLRHIR